TPRRRWPPTTSHLPARRTRRRPPHRRARWPAELSLGHSLHTHTIAATPRSGSRPGRRRRCAVRLRLGRHYDVAVLALRIVALLGLGAWLWLALLRGRF